MVRLITATEDRNLVDENSEASTTVTVGSSSDDDVHKPRQGALSHNQIQRRADEAVKQNARGIADRLADIAEEWEPDVLLLAGETQGRSAVRAEVEENVPALATLIQETDEGGTADTGGNGAKEALTGVVNTVPVDVHAGERLAQTTRFEEARTRNRIAEGPDAVAQATMMGAVDTVLLQHDDSAPGESEPLVSCANTDANVALIGGPVSGNIAALLRFEAPEELGEPELNK